METRVEDAYYEEKKRLELTAGEMARQLEKLESIPRYTGDNPAEQLLEAARETRRRDLRLALPEPYFGRLDFQEAGQPHISSLYIGKLGVEKPSSSELLVIDWRAPIASLFYSFTGGSGPAAYESPDGTIEGDVHLKRNFVIRKQTLQRLVDTYTRDGDAQGVTDEFLLYRLGENKDNRLRDIVSTIQAEQDAIIRAERDKALVIQGVAGSGKTTVALHRIAYLLYHYRDLMKAEKIIIFAPNRMFLDYISGVLPELGVGHIQQTTFSDWALDLLEHEIKLADPAERLVHWFDGQGKTYSDSAFADAPGRFKGSIAFMQGIEQALAAYETAAVPTLDYSPFAGTTLPYSKIRQWYDVEYKHEPLMKRRERVLARIKRWQEMELDGIWDTRIRKERKKQAAQKLREYTKRWTAYTAWTWYRELYADNGPVYLQEAERSRLEIPAEIRTQTAALAKKKLVQPEDLPALLHIRERFYGISGEHRFHHSVIDEAQDYSPYQVAVLQRHTRNGSFTILGDLSQGIHGYQGIHNWQELIGLFPEERRGYYTLNRSYRSTMEIIQFANAVLQCGMAEPPEPAVPVFRSGSPVQVQASSAAELVQGLLQDIERLLASSEQETGTLAILTRTEARSRELHRTLAKAGCEANLIVAGQQEYKGGLSILPVYLSKGLEFDTVLLVDVEPGGYPAEAAAAKLLYVGCTRALHTLKLYYSGQASPLIADIAGEFVARSHGHPSSE